MTTTSPAFSAPSVTASIAPCSPSNTRAVPSKVSASKPADFTTAPSGAREPRRIESPPVLWIGSLLAWMIAPSGSGGEPRPEDDGDTADAGHVGHDEPAERLHVGQQRRAVAEPVEVLGLQVH